MYFALGGGGDDHTRGKGADDVRDAEKFLGAKGHHEAEDKGQQGETVQVLVMHDLGHIPAEQPADEYADHTHEDEKGDDLDKDDHHADLRARQACHDGQRDQAEDVVDEGGC